MLYNSLTCWKVSISPASSQHGLHFYDCWSTVRGRPGTWSHSSLQTLSKARCAILPTFFGGIWQGKMRWFLQTIKRFNYEPNLLFHHWLTVQTVSCFHSSAVSYTIKRNKFRQKVKQINKVATHISGWSLCHPKDHLHLPHDCLHRHGRRGQDRGHGDSYQCLWKVSQWQPVGSNIWKSNEQFSSSIFKAAQMIKEALDKRFGTTWHVVVGEGFGFDISYELSRIFYMFFAGNLGVCAWKCSSY